MMGYSSVIGVWLKGPGICSSPYQTCLLVGEQELQPSCPRQLMPASIAYLERHRFFSRNVNENSQFRTVHGSGFVLLTQGKDDEKATTQLPGL